MLVAAQWYTCGRRKEELGRNGTARKLATMELEEVCETGPRFERTVRRRWTGLEGEPAKEGYFEWR